MLSLTKRHTAAAALALARLAPATADAKTPSSAMYSVTFHATMTERWQSNEDYADDCNLTGVMCTRVQRGEGSTKLTLRSKRPTKVMVLRGTGGRPPTVGAGTGEGVPLTGEILRAGSLVTDYEGPWARGNPDQKSPDTGCGTRTVSGDVNFAWRGRNQLGISIVDELPDTPCPSGPGTAWDWANDESPMVGDVLAQVAHSKFLTGRQFTVGGSRSWKGQIEPTSRASSQGHFHESADTTVTWQWSATFRKEGTKKKKR